MSALVGEVHKLFLREFLGNGTKMYPVRRELSSIPSDAKRGVMIGLTIFGEGLEVVIKTCTGEEFAVVISSDVCLSHVAEYVKISKRNGELNEIWVIVYNLKVDESHPLHSDITKRYTGTVLLDDNVDIPPSQRTNLELYASDKENPMLGPVTLVRIGYSEVIDVYKLMNLCRSLVFESLVKTTKDDEGFFKCSCGEPIGRVW